MLDALHEFGEEARTFALLLTETQQRSAEVGGVAFEQIRWYGQHVSLSVDAAKNEFTFTVNGCQPVRVIGGANAATQLMGLIRGGADVRQ